MDLEMVDAVKQVAAGKQVLDQRLGSLEPPGDQPSLQLTTRELEVLQLICARQVQ
jgi:DNA-binding NarL/FixJ family response regulator